MRYLSYKDVDDRKAAAIAQELASPKNSDMTDLQLSISEELTLSGAQVIAHDLKHSINIRHLKIWHGDGNGEQNGNVLQPIFEVAIQHCQELILCLNDDGVAKKLSATLLSLDDSGADNQHALQTLGLHIRPNLTEDAFQKLANGLRHAKLKCLELVSPNMISQNIISTIYCEAVRSVEELVLCGYDNDGIGGEDPGAFGNALIGNTTLQSVKIRLQPDLSLDDAVRLANGMNHSHIVHLEMCIGYHRLVWHRVDVENALYEGVARSPTIRHLVVGTGFRGTSGLARCLTRLHALKTHYVVMMEDLPALITGLISAPHLTSLDLGQWLNDEQDMLAVCAALPQLASLTDLSICGTLAFDEQPTQDSDYSVRPINLRLQHVRATGAEQLMVAVANHPSLRHLTLNGICGSNDIGFVGLAMIGTHLPNIKLKEFHLKWFCDQYGRSCNDESVKRAFQRACQAWVAGVRSNWYLRVLELRYQNLFPPSVIGEIDFYLDLNKSGRYLLHNIDGEDIPMGLWCHVLAKCSNKADHIFYHLRELPTLAYGGNGHATLSHELQNAHTEWPKRIPAAGTKRRREEQMS